MLVFNIKDYLNGINRGNLLSHTNALPFCETSTVSVIISTWCILFSYESIRSHSTFNVLYCRYEQLTYSASVFCPSLQILRLNTTRISHYLQLFINYHCLLLRITLYALIWFKIEAVVVYLLNRVS